MEQGRFYRQCHNQKVLTIASHLLSDEITGIYQVCERWGEEIDDVRYYDTYIIKTACGEKVLKQCEERESFNYENYLCKACFNVPQYYGSYRYQDEIWILLENIMGNDLRDMEDEVAILAADSLAKIQNYFWSESDDNRLGLWRNNALFIGYCPIYCSCNGNESHFSILYEYKAKRTLCEKGI